MKLETTFKEAVFLAPNVYGGISDEGEVTKVKGFKISVSFDNLFSLLNKENKL